MKKIKFLLLTFVIFMFFNSDAYATERQLNVQLDVVPCFTVTIPQSITGSTTNDTECTVTVSGDVGPADTITVKPSSTSFTIYNVEDRTLTRLVNIEYQEENTIWNCNEISQSVQKTGIIKVPDALTAGNWEGSIVYNITYNSDDPDIQEVVETFKASNALCTLSRTGSEYRLDINGTGRLITPEPLVESSHYYKDKLNDYSGLDVYISEGVTCLSDNYFKECKAIKTLHLPTTLKTLGSAVFRQASISEVDMSNVTTLDDQCFAFNLNIKNVVLNNELQVIPYMTFYSTPNLETVTLPANLKTIGTESFKDSGIKSISLPDGVETIMRSAFWNCTNLTELHIPSSVTLIEEIDGQECFKNVKKVVLHNTNMPIPENKWGALR